MIPADARSFKKFTHFTFSMNFSLEITHAADKVGEKAHLVPGAKRLLPLSTKARSTK